MKGMTIKAMTQACHGIYHGDEGAVDIEISAITTDSRKIQKNGMFIVICGEKSDGHDYIGKCFDDGRCAVFQSVNFREKADHIYRLNHHLQH